MKTSADAIYIVAGAMTGDVIGPAVDLRESRVCSFTCIYAGAPVGSLDIECSNDGGATWAIFSTTAVSAAGSSALEIGNNGFEFARLVYRFTSGTGTLEVQSSVKIDDIV